MHVRANGAQKSGKVTVGFPGSKVELKPPLYEWPRHLNPYCAHGRAFVAGDWEL